MQISVIFAEFFLACSKIKVVPQILKLFTDFFCAPLREAKNITDVDGFCL